MEDGAVGANIHDMSRSTLAEVRYEGLCESHHAKEVSLELLANIGHTIFMMGVNASQGVSTEDTDLTSSNGP